LNMAMNIWVALNTYYRLSTDKIRRPSITTQRINKIYVKTLHVSVYESHHQLSVCKSTEGEKVCLQH
jgi:hypothetical protein